MKKILTSVLVLVLLIGGLFTLTACGNKESSNEESKTTNVPKSEQTGTAGSNIPLKDNYEEAEYQIKVAFQNWLSEAYGDKIFDARIYVEKIYTSEEENEESLKQYNLGIDDVVFDVKYEIKPVEGVDPNIFTATSGEYDEESGWVKEKYQSGILRPNNDNSDQKYKITFLESGL